MKVCFYLYAEIKLKLSTNAKTMVYLHNNFKSGTLSRLTVFYYKVPLVAKN